MFRGKFNLLRNMGSSQTDAMKSEEQQIPQQTIQKIIFGNFCIRTERKTTFFFLTLWHIQHRWIEEVHRLSSLPSGREMSAPTRVRSSLIQASKLWQAGREQAAKENRSASFCLIAPQLHLEVSCLGLLGVTVENMANGRTCSPCSCSIPSPSHKPGLASHREKEQKKGFSALFPLSDGVWCRTDIWIDLMAKDELTLLLYSLHSCLYPLSDRFINQIINTLIKQLCTQPEYYI